MVRESIASLRGDREDHAKRYRAAQGVIFKVENTTPSSEARMCPRFSFLINEETSVMARLVQGKGERRMCREWLEKCWLELTC